MKISPFLISVGLFLIGLLAGTWLDPRPERPVVERGGWRVVQADFHVHTRLSDGFLSPVDVVVQAERRGLDAFALTEHNGIAAARIARAYSELVGGPTVIIGEEVTTRAFHVIGVGLTETVDWDQPLTEIMDTIKAQGGVVIAAHPVGRFYAAFEPVRDQIDAVELMHPIAFGSRGDSDDGGWSWDEMLQFYVEARAAGYELTPVGSSDYHFFSPLGVCRTYVFAADDSAEAIVDALREGRTVVFDLDGNAYGDPELIALLEDEPLEERDYDYNYAGAGAADRVTRVMGWIGVIGLLIFRPRRRRASREAGAAE